MYYLAKTVTAVSTGEREIGTRLIMKSSLKEKLQEEIKRLFDEAVETMDEDVWINNCSREDFDDDNGYFNRNILSIYTMFPAPGIEWEDINYAIVSDEQVREI